MVEGFKLSMYLDETGLAAEEFYYLYRIMLLEPDASDRILKITMKDVHEGTFLFSQMSLKYQENATIGGDKIDWKKICFSLEEKGFIEIWDKNDLSLTGVKVTDKFKKEFFISDVETAFMEVVAMYPKMVRINKSTSRYPALNEPLSVLAKEYNEKILLNGNKARHYRFLAITEMYLRDIDSQYAPYNLQNYFKAFEGIAIAYESGSQAERSNVEEM